MSDAKKFQVRATQWHVAKQGDDLYAENSYSIRINDEGGGEFVTILSCVEQGMGRGDGIISLEPEEWPALKAAIDHAVEQCNQSGE